MLSLQRDEILLIEIVEDEKQFLLLLIKTFPTVDHIYTFKLET